MLLQEQSALPVKSLLPGPRGGSAFRACSRRRVVALPKKNCSACRFPPTSFDVQIERGISRSITSGSLAPKYINHKEKLRCESLF